MKKTIANQVIQITISIVKNRTALGKEVTDWDVKSIITTLATMNGISMLDVSTSSMLDQLVFEILEDANK